MKRLLTLLSLAFSLTPAASEVYTGFNYGAFWGDGSNVKKVADFKDSFNYAQKLKAHVPFNSARLFTCKTHGTKDEPTGAFEAAVETKTKLFLGIWLSPAERGGPLDDIIKNELSALGKGFEKHGKALSDLVVGLSVGSEDIYRWEDTKEPGVAAEEVSNAIKKVKDAIAVSPFAQHMKDKPIGHVDTATHAVVSGADFYGMTAYPYWNKEPIEKAKESFYGSLEGVKQRAGNTPIWIAEMGWPVEGEKKEGAVASKENLQKYWKEVGCSIVGKYTTFWFQLIKDSEANQPDWAMLDAKTHEPRIDLSCAGESSKPGVPAAPASSPPAPPSTVPETNPNPTTLVTVPSPGEAKMPASPNPPTMATAVPSSPSTEPDQVTSTVRIQTTIMVTMQPPPPSSELQSRQNSSDHSTKIPTIVTSAPSPALLPSDTPWCVTVADIAWNGQFVPIAGNPAGPDGKCAPPPTYSGLPYGASSTAPPSSAAPKEPASATTAAPEQPSSKAPESSVAPPPSNSTVPNAPPAPNSTEPNAPPTPNSTVPNAPPAPNSSAPADPSSAVPAPPASTPPKQCSARTTPSLPSAVSKPTTDSTSNSKILPPNVSLPAFTFPSKTQRVQAAVETKRMTKRGLFWWL